MLDRAARTARRDGLHLERAVAHVHLANPEALRIRVRLGALSHFTPEHFAEHWLDASRGTVAEGSAVEATLDEDLDAEAAQGVVLESVTLHG